MKKNFSLFSYIFFILLSLHTFLYAAGNISEEEQKLIALLDRYKSHMPEITNKMMRAKDNETVKLGQDESRLIAETGSFFNELLTMKKGTQAYQSLRGKLPNWNTDYIGIERALMMGRALIVQKVLKDTLIQFYNDNPEAIGTIYGEMDIGTWVKMQTKTLQFDKDIDLSSLSTDDHLNMKLRDMFKENLQKITGVSDERIMINMDALITPHGKASSEVFIGEWGKTFAEMDLLSRGKWKLILLKLDDGRLIAPDEAKKIRQQGGRIKVVDIVTKEMPGSQLFWWRAFMESRDFEPPKVTMQTEPMLSLEMSRHLIADIEKGNYSGIDKLVKIMKYVERSYLYNQKATAAYRGEWDPFDDNDHMLGEFAVELTKAKQARDAAIEMAKVLEKYKDKLKLAEISGGDKEASDRAINELLVRSKKSIVKNAEVALALRLREIASVKDESRRNRNLDDMLKQMHEELETYKHHVGDYPEGRIKDIIWLSEKLRQGDKWSADVVKQTMDDLIEALRQENYQLDKGIIEYIFSPDDARELRIYLREQMKWTEEKVSKFIEDLRKKYPSLARGYDRLKKDYQNMGESLPTFAKIHKKIKDFNEDWSNTIEGSNLLKSLDFADKAISVYDAYMNEDTHAKGAVKAAGAILKIKATGDFPSFSVAEGILQAYQTGDTGPAIKSFAFYYFPTIGAFWGLGEKLQRFDVLMRDKEFLSYLDKMRSKINFDPKTGHVIGIKTGSKYGDILEYKYSPDLQLRADNFADFFMKGENLISGDELPEFRYWLTLIPRSPKSYGYGSDFVDKGDEALQDAGETNIGKKLGLDGMDLSGKKAKYAKLRKYFSHNEDLLAAVLILENKNNAPAFTNLAGQKLAQKREEMISQMENQVERQMWKSLLYLLEASATPPKDLEKLVKDLEKLESDLNLAGYDLSDLRGLNNGMMDAIKKEVQSQISKDYYGVFVYKKYYDAYSQIKRIQDQIIQLWTEEYKVDWQKMINPPLKMIIGGRKNCAPRLTLDIVNDLDKTKAALSAHRNRGRKIDSDLSDALGHNPKSKEELEYLKKLAQLGFEIEHLFDDCKERSIDTCEADTVQAINERLIQYKEYLKNLKISECTYQYTDWGECDKIKKIQTRKLIKKTPEGCIEKEKPETQRACNPDKKDTEGKKPEKEQLEKEKIEKEKIEKEKDWRNLIELKKKLLSGDSKNIESTLEAINKGLEKIEKEMMEWIQGYKPYLDSLRKADEEAFGKLRAALFRLTDEKVRCRQCSTGGACPKYCGEFDECIKEPKNLHNKQQDWIKKIETEMQRVIHSLQEGTIEQRLQKIEDTASKYGLPRPYPIKVEPPVKYQSYCLGIVDSDKEDRLTVELRTNRITLKPGNIATISAVVSGGKLPYTYKWSENVSGSGTNVQFVSQKKGDYIISVTVFDSEGKKANGQITLKVESIEVTIEGLPKQVVYGTKHTLIAKIPGPDKASSSELKKFEDEMKRLKCAKAYDPNEEDWNGCYSCPALEKGKTKSITRCRPKTGSSGITVTWQSSPNIQFDPPSGEGPTTALFNSMGDNGKVKIWAIVEKDKSESFETPQYEVNVVPPKFMLFFDPDKGRGKVGQEISATLKTDPDIDSKLIDYEWSEPEFSKRKQYEANAGKIGFIPKDAKPVKLLVAPKVPYYRTPIGGAISDEYTASPYTVTISEPRYRQSKPVIWKCDTRSGGARSCGNVEVDYEFAVDYDILMRAEVLPKLDGVNYKWTVSPQGCTLMNDITQDLTIKCSLTGTYTASVTVTKEIEGIKAEIGSVSRSVNITISQEEMKNSNKRKEAAEKLAKSKEFAKQGKLDEAIVAAEEAERLDPKNIEASNLAAQLIKERQYILREIKNIKDLADQAQFDAAQKSFTQIFNKYGKYQPVWEVQHYIGNQITKYNTLVRDRFYEVQKANDEKNFSNALEIIKNIQQTMKLQPVDVQKLQQIEQWTAKMETIKGKKREILRKGEERFNAGDYKGAYEALKEGLVDERNYWGMTDPERTHYVELQSKAYKMMQEQQNNIETATMLRNKGISLEKQGKLTDAVPKYKESLKYLPDPKLESHIKELEDRIANIQNRTQTADRLWSECTNFYNQKKMEEALSKCRESIKIWPDTTRQDYVRKMEAAKANAKKLIDEGGVLQNQGKLQEALNKYRESVKIWPNVALEDHIVKVENRINEINLCAQKWNEGAILQKQNRLQEALAKFKASYECLPTDAKASHIKIVEDYINKSSIGTISQEKQIARTDRYKYFGCYRDQGDPYGTGGRDISEFVHNDSKMTTEMCISICTEKGFAYAGTQYGSWCFCGNSYGKSGTASNCDMKCSGNPNQICGGSWANSVYSTGVGKATQNKNKPAPYSETGNSSSPSLDIEKIKEIIRDQNKKTEQYIDEQKSH